DRVVFGVSVRIDWRLDARFVVDAGLLRGARRGVETTDEFSRGQPTPAGAADRRRRPGKVDAFDQPHRLAELRGSVARATGKTSAPRCRWTSHFETKREKTFNSATMLACGQSCCNWRTFAARCCAPK